MTSRGPLFNKRPPRFQGILLAVAAFAIALSLILATSLLAACSGGADATIRANGGARVELNAEIPAPLAAKLRKLTSLSEDAPLFDASAAAKAAKSRKGVGLASFSAPTVNSFASTIELSDLAASLASPELASSGALGLVHGSGWTELRVHLERGHCAPLLAFVPGLDPELVDALAPPALDPDPVTVAEYRRMLQGLVGEKAAAAIEAAKIHFAVQAPTAIIASSGGKASGRAFSVELPALDLLVLEKPVDFSLRWTD
jgi:hypothetical protein